jgi:hypothetical protein
MLDLANDLRSLSDFKRNTVDLLDCGPDTLLC